MTRKKQADAPDMNKAHEDFISWLVQEIAHDRALLEKRIEGLYSCMSDQHEINQRLTDRLFILENHNEMNADKSASVH